MYSNYLQILYTRFPTPLEMSHMMLFRGESRNAGWQDLSFLRNFKQALHFLIYSIVY